MPEPKRKTAAKDQATSKARAAPDARRAAAFHLASSVKKGNHALPSFTGALDNEHGDYVLFMRGLHKAVLLLIIQSPVLPFHKHENLFSVAAGVGTLLR